MESGGEKRLACAASVDLFGQSKMNVRQEYRKTKFSVTKNKCDTKVSETDQVWQGTS